MAKIRVYELARDLNMTNKSLIEKMKDMDIDVEIKSHMSVLEDEAVAQIKAGLFGQKAETVVETRVKPTVIRRRKKTVTVEVPPEIEAAEEAAEEAPAAVTAEAETAPAEEPSTPPTIAEAVATETPADTAETEVETKVEAEKEADKAAESEAPAAAETPAPEPVAAEPSVEVKSK